MKQAIYIAVALFWLAAAALWIAGTDSGPAVDGMKAGAGPAGALKVLDAATVARHASPSDCWIIIRDRVYDVTEYIPSHPTPPEVITAFCGVDATHAFETKDRGRPHSPAAWKQLGRYQVGILRAK